MLVEEIPKLLPFYPQMPAKYHGQFFDRPPTIVIIHSGARADNVAEFFRDTGRVWYKKGRRWIKVSAHINWSREQEGFVQSVPLNCMAWHAGGSQFRGKKSLNEWTIGIELPGPYGQNPRPEQQRLDLRHLLAQLRLAIPTLETITGHQYVDYGKKDPGPGVDESWFDGLGYEVVWEKCRNS